MTEVAFLAGATIGLSAGALIWLPRLLRLRVAVEEAHAAATLTRLGLLDELAQFRTEAKEQHLTNMKQGHELLELQAELLESLEQEKQAKTLLEAAHQRLELLERRQT